MKDLRTDPEGIEKLVASGLVLSGLTLGSLVHRRFRLLALGACGLLCASALGYSPLATLLGSREEESDAFDDEEITPERVGVPPIAALGVPHRIPEEEVLSQGQSEEPSDFE